MESSGQKLSGWAVSIFRGPDKICAIPENGLLNCTNMLQDIRITLPSNLGKVRAFAFGTTYDCAIALDGSPKCWKNNSPGNNSPVEESIILDIGKVTAISSDWNTCFIKEDESLVCFNNKNLKHPLNIPHSIRTSKVISISTRGPNICVVKKEDGSPFCWNTSTWKTEADAVYPSPKDLGNLIAISTGIPTYEKYGRWSWWSGDYKKDRNGKRIVSSFHTCAMKDDGTIACWNQAGKKLPVPEEFTVPDPSQFKIDQQQ